MNNRERIRRLLFAINDNKRIIGTSKSPHERDMARSRVKILQRKLKEFRGVKT